MLTPLTALGTNFGSIAVLMEPSKIKMERSGMSPEPRTKKRQMFRVILSTERLTRSGPFCILTRRMMRGLRDSIPSMDSISIDHSG